MRARARPCRRRRAARPCRRPGPPRRTRTGSESRSATAAQPDRPPAWQAGADEHRVASPWSRRRRRSTPPTTATGWPRWSPADADLVVLPGGVRPRLRRGRLRRQRRTPSRWTGRSRPRSRGWPPSAARPWWPGCSSRRRTPAGPFNTLVRARRGRGGVPQDPPLRLLRLPRVRPAHAPARSSRSSSRSAGFRSA